MESTPGFNSVSSTENEEALDLDDTVTVSQEMSSKMSGHSKSGDISQLRGRRVLWRCYSDTFLHVW